MNATLPCLTPRRIGLLLALILPVSFVVLTALAAESDKAKGHPVMRVIDGDTIVVKIDGKEEKVRLIGVDTPETVHPNKPVERFGKEASRVHQETAHGQVSDPGIRPAEAGQIRPYPCLRLSGRGQGAGARQPGDHPPGLRPRLHEIPVQPGEDGRLPQGRARGRENKRGLWADAKVEAKEKDKAQEKESPRRSRADGLRHADGQEVSRGGLPLPRQVEDGSTLEQAKKTGSRPVRCATRRSDFQQFDLHGFMFDRRSETSTRGPNTGLAAPLAPSSRWSRTRPPARAATSPREQSVPTREGGPTPPRRPG